MTKRGDELDGRDYNTLRAQSMTETVPPDGYTWHHTKAGIGWGNDSTVSELAEQTAYELRELRLAWLDQFTMEIQEEGDNIYWRWYDGEHSCRWWERRPAGSPPPTTPGFWPSDV